MLLQDAVEPVSKLAYISNRLERTLASSKYTTSGAADDRLCMLGGSLLAVAVGGGGDDLWAGVGDDHIVLVVGAAEARRLDAPLDGKAHAR